MPAAEQIQEIRRFALEGPLSTAQGIVVGCVLAALAYWSLFRIPKTAPHRFAWLLWFCRAGAIAILIWMLLGPVNVTVYQHTTPKSLAILNDVSESMKTFDPPDDKAVAHWKALDQDSPTGKVLATCDKAAVAAATAHRSVEKVLREIHDGVQGKETRRRLESAERAAADALKLSVEAGDLLESSQDELAGEFLSRAREISSALDSADLKGIASIAKSGNEETFAPNTDDRGKLEEYERKLSHSARALAGLSDRIAGKMTTAEKPAGGGSSLASLARGDKVNRLLDDGAKTWLAEHEKTARIHRYTFDREVTSATDAAKADPANNDGAATEKKAEQKDEKKAVAADEKSDRSPFTNISAALERIGRDAARENIEAVVMFTDGRHNDPAAKDPRDVAKLIGSVPFYIVPVGTNQMQKDLILQRVQAPTAVVQNDQITIESILSAFDCAGETAVLELTEGKTLVERQEINIASVRRDYHVRFSIPAKEVGRHEYALTVSPITGEMVPTNNAQTFGVDVVDAKMNILLADDFPRWEYRYLVNLFERSPERIEYDQLLLHPSERASGQMSTTTQLPRDVDGWAKYRVAILGDIPPDHFDADCQTALKDFVSVRGGTVIVVAGAQAMPQAYAGMPLLDLIPVTAGEALDPAQGFQLELTPEGKLTSAMQIADEAGMSEQVWKDVSRQLPVYSLSQYCVPKATARTLIRALRDGGSAEGEQKAFLCWQTVGRGRVIYLSAPTIYQLRMKYGDRYHHRFWGQVIRWSIAKDISQGSKTVKLAADRSRVSVGDMLQVVANLSTVDGQPVLDAQVRAEAKMDGNSTGLIELKPDTNIPGRYLGEYAPAAQGTLTLQAFGPDVTQLLQAENYTQSVETAVTVDPLPSTETEDPRTNTPLLRQIAGLTGGQIVPPTAVDEVVALTDLAPRIEEQTVRGPLWNKWIYLWLITGLLTIDWAVRKSTGRP